jgi:hypothetical protein
MRLPTGIPTSVVLIFLSSGDDVLELRELVNRLVEESVNPVLRQNELSVRVEVDGWDRTAAHRVPSGEKTNTEFVRRACNAHLVLGILRDELGDGTREELEAALEKDDVELSVVWCVDRDGDWPETSVGKWLGPMKERLLFDRAGDLGTVGPAIAIVRILLEAVMTAARQNQDQELLRERR